MKKLKLFFLFLGLALFGLLVYRAGPSLLLSNLLAAGWGFAAVVAVALGSIVVMGVGWKVLLDAEGSRAGILELSAASVVGAAINFLTPGSLGGEPVKAALLSPKVRTENLVSSVVLHNVLYWLSNLLLIAMGFLGAVFFLHLPTRLLLLLGAAAAGVAVPILTAAWLVHRGAAEKVVRAVTKLGLRLKDPERYLTKARQADQLIQKFKRTHPKAFWGAFTWVFLGRALSVLEVWVILTIMGHEVSVPTAFLVQSTSLLVYVIFAFVPSQVGANEGASFLLFPYLGLTSATGLAMEMLRRLRVVVLVVLGLLLLAGFNLVRPKGARPSSQAGESAPPEATSDRPVGRDDQTAQTHPRPTFLSTSADRSPQPGEQRGSAESLV